MFNHLFLIPDHLLNIKKKKASHRNAWFCFITETDASFYYL